jgi:hypothetical protein
LCPAPQGCNKKQGVCIGKGLSPQVRRGRSMNEFEESVTPGSGNPVTAMGEFNEDVTPLSGNPVRTSSIEWDVQKTRRWLALGLLVLVGLLSFVPTVALIFGDKLHFTSEEYREVTSMVTPVVALASAAFGFFFASDDRKHL